MKDWLMDTKSVMDKENVNCSGHRVKGEGKHLSIYWLRNSISSVKLKRSTRIT